MIVNPQQDIAAATVRCQKLLQRIPHLAWLMNERGEIVCCNQLWCEYVGTADDGSLSIFAATLSAAELDRWLLAWEEAKRSQQTLEIELKLKSRSGAWERFQVELTPDCDASGQTIWIGTAMLQRVSAQRRGWTVVPDSQQSISQREGSANAELCDTQGFPGLADDITDDRQRNEEALRRSEEFIRRILENNQDCIKVMDLAGRILYMNDGGKILMEIDDFATIAKTQWLTFWSEQEAEAASAAFNTAKAGGIGRFEGYCATAKNTPKWWEVVVTAIRDADDRVEQILSVSRDITERKQAEIDLRASEELFRHTFEDIPIGFCHVALDGTWLQVNRKFCETIGYTKAELLATTFQSITEPADLAQDFAFIERLLSGEINEGTLEKRYIHKQGHHVWINLTASLIRSTALAEPSLWEIDSQNSTPQYFLCAIEDISRRKQLELLSTAQTSELKLLNNSLMLTQQRLSERNEELNSFGYIVSHDLKAPLRAIVNLSEWIEEDLEYRLLEHDKQQFQLLRQRVRRMDALIDGLLHYSRVGRQDLAIETFDVAQLLTETIDSLPIPVGFQIEIVPPLPTLATKRILLSQVFANLLSNAIKHHDRADGRVEITAEDLGDRYRFAIADDGPGIPAGAARSRIFEIFQTLKPSISTANTGIGLALVKKIVESEGGQIWLDADRIAGACFYFTWLKLATDSP